MVGGTGVEWLDDDEAFMQLVLSNTQGELSPLEYGMHALKAISVSEGGRGKRGGIREYAARVGRDEANIRKEKAAAEVALNCGNITAVSDADLFTKTYHLYEISKAPEETWIVLAGETNFGLVRSCETLAHVGRTRQHTAKTS